MAFDCPFLLKTVKKPKKDAFKTFILLLLAALAISGCELGWGGDDDDGDTPPAAVADDILDTVVTAEVVSVDGETIVIETETGIVLKTTVPEGEVIAPGDTVEVIVTFEGSQEDNDWFLVAVEYLQTVPPEAD